MVKLFFFFDDDVKKDVNLIIPKGHYSVERLAKELENSFKKYNFEMKIRTYTTFAQMIISNPSNKKIKINSYLADLLGLSQEINFLTLIKTLNSPTTYFIHCDLVDKQQNLFNGKPSCSVLACYDIRGKTHEKINYKSSQLNVLRDVSAEKREIYDSFD